MKEFTLEEVFLLSQIIDKMELKIEADKISKTIQAEKLESKDDALKLGKDVMIALGIDISVKFVSSLHKASKEVIQLIANMTGKEIETVKKMGIKEIKQFFIDLSEMEGLADFFEQAGK